jgi:hypothetical protein
VVAESYVAMTESRNFVNPPFVTSILVLGDEGGFSWDVQRVHMHGRVHRYDSHLHLHERSGEDKM